MFCCLIWVNLVVFSSNGGVFVPTFVQLPSGSRKSITLSLDDCNKIVQLSLEISL